MGVFFGGSFVAKHALIVNLIAGNGRCRKIWPTIEGHLRAASIDYHAFFTEKPGHAKDLAREAVQSGFDTVVSVGGDGTLSEVVNGIYGTGATLGVIPAGSGNDFCRSFAFDLKDIAQSCEVLVSGKSRPLDVGRVDGRYFINVGGAGFDAEVGNMANIWGKKHFPGYAAYVASILRVLLSFNPRELTIKMDGQELTRKCWLVAVGNAQYFGGGFWVTPNADVADQLFDVCVVGETSKLELLRVLPKVMKGAHLDHPAVDVYRASKVTIAGPKELVSQADGEIIGNLPVQFSIAEEQLQVILP